MSRQRFFLGLTLLAASLSAAFFIAPKIALGQIVINEIMYDLAGADDKHEWVELYNNGGAPVDLTDWKFNDGDTATNHALNAPPKNNSRGSIVLGANAYLLLADDAIILASDLPSYSGTIIDTVLNLSNTGATLKLLNKDGVEIASSGYNKDLGAAGNGRTLEWDGAALKESIIDGGTPGRQNSVSNSAGAPSAAPSDSPAPTNVATASATPAPGYQYSQKIFINEFMPWPETGAKEWVEIINLDDTAINLSGWQIDDANASTSAQALPADTVIAPGEFLVISFNKNVLNNNDGDKVRLLWPDDQAVHAVLYKKATQSQAAAKFDNGWLWTNRPTPGLANKKSSVGNNEELSLANASVNNAQVVTTEETVTSPASAPARTATQPTRTPTPVAVAAATPTNTASSNAEALSNNINLTAAAGEPLAKNFNSNPFLALGGVVLLAALAAGGLIYFRRLSKPVDDSSFDD